jgi:NADPH-dependent 7-cyano-7-deazaguanine reductase QueF
VGESMMLRAFVQRIGNGLRSGEFCSLKSQSGNGEATMLKTVPNEGRCDFTQMEHVVPIKDYCPISHNPAGGHIMIKYDPLEVFIEVASLRSYCDSYKGGKGEIRSMEGTIQAIAQDCANTVKTCVTVEADLYINPSQGMKLKCIAFPAELRKAAE